MVRKGEIACNKQFLLFTQCFPPYMALIFHFKCTLKCRLQFLSIWTRLKICRLVISYPFPKQALVFTCLQDKSFENTVGKGEIAHNEQFLLFPQCFYPYEELSSIFNKFELSSANSFGSKGSKICCLGKG